MADLLDPITTSQQSQAVALIRSLILETSPTTDLSQGSAVDSLVVQNQALPTANLQNQIEALRLQLGLSSASAGDITLTSAEIDAIAANYRLERKSAAACRGTVTCVFISQSVQSLDLTFRLAAAVGGQDAVFSPTVSFTCYPPGTPGATTSATSAFFRQRQDGLYEVDVPVVQTADSIALTGYAISVSQGQVFRLLTAAAGFRSATATSTFTGGIPAETDAELIARARLGPVPKILSSTAQIRAYLSQYFPASSVGVIGRDSLLMTRDRANILLASTGSRADVYVRPPEAVGQRTVAVTDTTLKQVVTVDNVRYSFDVSGTPAVKAREVLSSTSTDYIGGRVTNAGANTVEIELGAGIGLGGLRVKSLQRVIRRRESYATPTTVTGGQTQALTPVSGLVSVVGYQSQAEGGLVSLQDVTSLASIVYQGMTDRTPAIAAADYYGALCGSRRIRLTDPNKDVSILTEVGSFSATGGGNYNASVKQTTGAYSHVLNDVYAYTNLVLLGYPSVMSVGDESLDALLGLYDSSLQSPGSDMLVKVAIPCEVGVTLTISGQNQQVNYGTVSSPQYNAPMSWLTTIANAINAVPLGTDRLSFDHVTRALTAFLTTGIIRDIQLSGLIRGPAGDVVLAGGAALNLPTSSGLKYSPDNIGFVCGTTSIQVNFV